MHIALINLQIVRHLRQRSLGAAAIPEVEQVIDHSIFAGGHELDAHKAKIMSAGRGRQRRLPETRRGP